MEKTNEPEEKTSTFKGYYFSTPIAVPKNEGHLVVAVAEKNSFDKQGHLEDIEPRAHYNLCRILKSKGFGEYCESVFEVRAMTDKEVKAIFKDLGFDYNPKLDNIIKDMWGITEEEKLPSIIYMMIGLPASGKSQYVRDATELAGMEIVSKDLCDGNERKELRQLEEMLLAGKEVIVDDTNYDRKARAKIFALAKEYDAKVVGIYINTSKDECLRRNKVRVKKVPSVAIHTIAKRFECPTLEEGFSEVKVVE